MTNRSVRQAIITEDLRVISRVGPFISMKSRRSMLRSTNLLVLTALCAAAWAHGVDAERKTVCSITVNSSDEQAMFRRSLPPEKFQFAGNRDQYASRSQPIRARSTRCECRQRRSARAIRAWQANAAGRGVSRGLSLALIAGDFRRPECPESASWEVRERPPFR